MNNIDELLIADAEQLENKSLETLAEWWCTLNRWEWPNEIQNPEEVPKNYADGTPRRAALMNKIDEAVPHKLLSYTWNKKRMSVEEHDKWFAETFGG